MFAQTATGRATKADFFLSHSGVRSATADQNVAEVLSQYLGWLWLIDQFALLPNSPTATQTDRARRMVDFYFSEVGRSGGWCENELFSCAFTFVLVKHTCQTSVGNNSFGFTVWEQMQREEKFGIRNLKTARRTRENTPRCILFAISVFFRWY